jgi:hypothetical protein
MKTKLATTTLALACLLGQPAFGQAYTYFGMPDCGQWINNKKPSDRFWLFGFMSGLNSMYTLKNKDGDDPLDNLSSADQIVVWMDNYCQKNPLKKVGAGALDLFFELSNKTK